MIYHKNAFLALARPLFAMFTIGHKDPNDPPPPSNEHPSSATSSPAQLTFGDVFKVLPRSDKITTPLVNQNLALGYNLPQLPPGGSIAFKEIYQNERKIERAISGGFLKGHIYRVSLKKARHFVFTN